MDPKENAATVERESANGQKSNAQSGSAEESDTTELDEQTEESGILGSEDEESIGHTFESESEVDSETESTTATTANIEQTQLDELKQQAEEHYQRYLRTQADFDNFRRRSRQEKEEFAKYASMKLLEQLLPIVDNLERALSSSKESNDLEALTKGVDMIFRQFEQVLEQEGLKKMETLGQPFNPEFHQAIMQVESDEHDEGVIVEEVQKGYILKDKILRPAMVKVST